VIVSCLAISAGASIIVARREAAKSQTR
jgi:hypothetical protein